MEFVIILNIHLWVNTLTNYCFSLFWDKITVMYEMYKYKSSYLVAKVCPWESLMCTMSKDPGWRSLLTTVPTRPKLRPPVIMHRFPESNLMESMILLVAISSWMVSFTLMMGSGYLIVLPSWVTKNGIPFGPVWTLFTLHSLYYKHRILHIILDEQIYNNQVS